MKKIAAICLGAGLSFALLANGTALAQERTKAPEGAAVYFIDLKDGATVKSPVVVRFGLRGMGIAPAGVRFDNTGHHHLFIDTPLPENLGLPLPSVAGKVLHFGKGQTETSVELPPGKHTLQLVLGDALHIPFEPLVASDKITIVVK
jgi:hypothetical protein